MSIKSDIKKLSLLYLRKELKDNDPNWAAMTKLKDQMRSHPLIEVFTKWASANRYTALSGSPLYIFLRDLPKYVTPEAMAGDVAAPDAAQLANEGDAVDVLCADLAFVTENVSFTGKYRAALADLRKSATDKEIKNAFIEFVSDATSSDDRYTRNTVVMRFAEGGGKDYIAKARRQIEMLKEQEVLQEKLTLEFQQKRARELAAVKLEEEDESTEIVLPEVE